MEEDAIKATTNKAENKPRFLKYYEKYMLMVGIMGQMLFYSQGIKIFMNKSAVDISVFGFSMGLISVTSWLIYGCLIKNKVLIISNAFAVIGALLVMAGIAIHGA